MTQKKLWGGRFATTTNELMEQFSASIGYDWRLYDQDIRGSMAHARMLSAKGILSEAEFIQIRDGLDEIRREIENNQFEWSTSLEDIHMNIEAKLTERIGEVGKKLHTGRSRNDQVATDIRLYLREQLDQLGVELTALQLELVTLAAQEVDTIMPGYTHMQSAQPVTFGHHLLAWNQMLERDHDRFQDCRRRLNRCPLGAAALAGTSYPIDPQMTAHELGFDGVCRNSLDAVSDRDFLIEFNAHAALMMIHLSRMAEELILWSSDAFGFVDLGEAFCTGSSIMPQKKNPDVAELTRGKCGRVSGNLMTLLMLMKGQPLSYNRDNQEDKEPLFDTLQTVSVCLQVFSAMLPGIRVHRDTMFATALKGYATATDLADYLVKKGLAFRDAHEVVGQIVRYAMDQEQPLTELALTTLRQFSDRIESDVYDILTLSGSVTARNHVGGTAPEQVRREVARAKKILTARGTKAG